jgi:CheY-like chemotaxis protein/anti-anti-sigma regulatory factor
MASKFARPPAVVQTTHYLTVIHFAGRSVRLDGETLCRIHDRLLALADEPDTADLLFDFGNVDYVVGRALGTLVVLQRRLLARGRQMSIGNVIPQVLEVFTGLKLENYLNLSSPQNDAPPSNWRQSGSSGAILVVNDETAGPCLLAARLRRAGYRVWLAADRHRAVELYEQHLEDIAVILLNKLSPAMDGLQTLTALQRICPTARSCFLTDGTPPHAVTALLQFGVAQVFRKPFPSAEALGADNPRTSGLPRRRQHRWIIPS